jgi:pyruvate,water dikinase
MGMTTVQKHHAWGYHVAAEHTQLPPSKGAHVKIFKGRVYLGFALIDNPAEIALRAPKFGQLIEHCMDHWDEFYNGYIDEVKASLETLAAVDADRLTNPHLLDHLRKAEEINRRNWEIHFILMYPADAIYLVFEQYCKDHGMDEQGFLRMLAGFHSKPAETDNELWRMAKDVRALGLERAFMDSPVNEIREKLGEHADGRAWCERLERFLTAYGNRINAAHLDVLFPTWREDPTPVLETVRG